MSKVAIFAIVVVFFVLLPLVGMVSGSLGQYLGSPRPVRAREAAPPSAPEAASPRVREAAPPKPRGQRSSKPKTAPALKEYQVPAGTVIAVKLETTARSATSSTGDQVDASLTEAINQDGVELVPAGSMMHGTVVDGLAASPRELRGRVAVAFFVIEHAATGSRAAIKTRTIAVEAPLSAEKKPKPADVQLAAGQTLNVVLTKPLLVFIPK